MDEAESSEKKKLRTGDHPPTNPAASCLTEDLILEVLSRLPAKSLHRFKCVSPSWRDLIADPAHRKKLPQTLAGFLYGTYDSHFANVSGGPAPLNASLPFLLDKYLHVQQLDTCNGLLLCRCYSEPPPPSSTTELDSHYVVCNPATESWVELPPHPRAQANDICRTPRLACDPAVSSHFHVLEFEETDRRKHITGVNIYSSQTGAWNHRGSELGEEAALFSGITSAYLGGMLHLLGMLPMNDFDSVLVVVVVDMEGKVWKTIHVPHGFSFGTLFGTIASSQGCLHYANTIQAPTSNKMKKKDALSLAPKIALWYLEDYDSKEWVLKHSISTDKLLSRTGMELKVAAIHPDCDTVFLLSCETGTLASCDMRRQKFHILNLEKNSWHLLPYVPLFSDSLAEADGL